MGTPEKVPEAPAFVRSDLVPEAHPFLAMILSNHNGVTTGSCVLRWSDGGMVLVVRVHGSRRLEDEGVCRLLLSCRFIRCRPVGWFILDLNSRGWDHAMRHIAHDENWLGNLGLYTKGRTEYVLLSGMLAYP